MRMAIISRVALDNERKKVKQLRKALRWALRLVLLSELGRCAHCMEPYHGSTIRHERNCGYAKACKLAGLKVKAVGDRPSPTRPKNYAAAGPTTVDFGNPNVLGQSKRVTVGYKKKPTRKGKRA